LCLDEKGYLTKINQKKLGKFNKRKESPVYDVDKSFTGFSMLTVITGKCGNVKTSFLQELILHTNKIVKTFYRNSLTRINSSIALGSLSSDCLSATESLEIRGAQYQNLEGLQENFLIPFANKEEKIKYLNEKKRSSYTYSSLFMMLQYILNRCHPHFDENRSDSIEFNSKLNDHLETNEFPYNIYVVNGTLILDNRKHHSPLLEPNELNKREQIKLLVLLWLFDTDKIEIKDTVFLLDEIDTECDANNILWLITGLKHLISKLKIQIVLTTNNPITMSLVPLECLCIIETHVDDYVKYARIKKARTKSEAIATFTDNTLFINEPYLIVFVEGKVDNDLSLYSMIYQRLKQSGSINTISPIFFYQMGDKMFSQFFLKNKATLTNQETIDNIFGINDGDDLILEAYEHLECKVLADETKKHYDKYTTNIKLLKRYNIENYIYDPICIMIVLINLKKEFAAATIKDAEYGKQLDKLFKLLTKSLNQNQIKQLNDTKIDENFIQSIGRDIFNIILTNMSDFLVDKLQNCGNNHLDYFKSQSGLFKEFTDKLKHKTAKIKLIKVAQNVFFEYHPILLYHNGKNIQTALKKEYNKLQIFKYLSTMLKELDNVINLNIYVFNDLEDIIKSFKI